MKAPNSKARKRCKPVREESAASEAALWPVIVDFQRKEHARLLEKYEAVVRVVIASGNSELIRQVDAILALARDAAGDARSGKHACANCAHTCRDSSATGNR